MEQSIFDTYKRLKSQGLSGKEAIEYLESKLGQLPEHIKEMLRNGRAQ